MLKSSNDRNPSRKISKLNFGTLDSFWNECFFFLFFFHWIARSPIFPYSYQTTAAAVQPIERPLGMSAPTTPYSQRQTAIVGPMAMQRQQTPTFPTNLCTNPETALAHVCSLPTKPNQTHSGCSKLEFFFKYFASSKFSDPTKRIRQYWNKKHSIWPRVSQSSAEINEQNMW